MFLNHIRKDDMIKTYKDGGVNLIDFDIMNGVLKLKSFICNNHSLVYCPQCKVIFFSKFLNGGGGV